MPSLRERLEVIRDQHNTPEGWCYCDSCQTVAELLPLLSTVEAWADVMNQRRNILKEHGVGYLTDEHEAAIDAADDALLALFPPPDAKETP